MLTVVLIVLLITTLIAYEWSIRCSRVWKMLRSQFPGVFSLPFVGNALQLGTTPEVAHDNLLALWKKLGRKSFTVVLGSDLLLMLTELEDVKAILSSSTNVSKSEQQLQFLKHYFGDQNIVHSTGDRHRVMRKILTPSFHFKLLEQYLELSNKEADILINKFKKHVDGPAMDTMEPLRSYAINLICGAAMGIDCKGESEEGNKYVQAGNEILSLAVKRQYSVIYRYDYFYKNSALHKLELKTTETAHGIIDSIISRRRKEFEEHIKPLLTSDDVDVETFISENRTKLTFIDVMLMSKLPDGSPIPDKDIRMEVNILIFAGYDTTSTTLAFVLSNLAKYRHLQDKAYQEQVGIFKEDPEREPTLKDLNNMHYLKRFIKESMRLYPTADQLARSIVVDTELPSKKPHYTNIAIPIKGGR